MEIIFALVVLVGLFCAWSWNSKTKQPDLTTAIKRLQEQRDVYDKAGAERWREITLQASEIARNDGHNMTQVMQNSGEVYGFLEEDTSALLKLCQSKREVDALAHGRDKGDYMRRAEGALQYAIPLFGAQRCQQVFQRAVRQNKDFPSELVKEVEHYMTEEVFQ